MTESLSHLIKLERTYDFELIRKIFTHPRIWPSISNDFSPAMSDFRPSEAPGIHYMVARLASTSEILGVCIAHWIHNPEVWEIHHAILPSAYPYTKNVAKAFEDWIFSAETPCRLVVGFTPECNKLALRFALRHGMKPSGILPNAYLKNGVRYDIIVLTKERKN